MDGYHPLKSVFQTISLSDEMTIKRGRSSGLSLSVEGANIDSQDNLISKIYADYSDQLPDLAVQLKKRIPLGAGLGGGSSDAAAFLRAIQTEYGIFEDEASLQKAAVTYGADIPFFLTGGTAVVTGIGEVITPIEFCNDHYVLIYPDIAVSTAEVYRLYDEAGNFADENTEDDINSLTSVVFEHFPDVKKVANQIEVQTGQKVLMSGSGSSLFFRVSSESEAQQISTVLKEWMPDISVYPVHSVNAGSHLVHNII